MLLEKQQVESALSGTQERLCSNPWRTRQSLLRHVGFVDFLKRVCVCKQQDIASKFRARIQIEEGDRKLLGGALLQVLEKFVHNHA